MKKNMAFVDVCRECGNCFLTKEEAEKELARRKPDWKKQNYGWNVIYNPTSHKLFANMDYNHLNDGTLRFATQEDAEESIKNHEKEWKIYLDI